MKVNDKYLGLEAPVSCGFLLHEQTLSFEAVN